MSNRVLLDVQGLRGLAVVFVVLFHLWPTVFQNGFLGVDVFFVISGFIMCLILHNKTIDFSTIYTFYFRRFRRIIPLYITIITCTIYAAYHVMNQLEYKTVTIESRTAMFFVSNMFNLPETGYFGPSNVFPLFLHTWSLSVEIQFYLVVPLIFYVLSRCNAWSKRMGWSFLAILGLVSLVLQKHFSYDENRSHMAFYCRIWQFIAGFVAYYIRYRKEYSGSVNEQYGLLVTNNEKLGFSTSLSRLNVVKQTFTISNITILFMVLQLFLRYTENKEVERILITLTSAAFLSNGNRSILSMKQLVSIGDVSYAIYLVHWPCLVLFKFGGFGRNLNGEGIGFLDGVFLITSIFFSGYILEITFKKLSSYLTSWLSLILTLILLYSIAYGAGIYIERRSWQNTMAKSSNSTRGMSLEERVISVYEQRNAGYNNLSLNEALQLNADMVAYAYDAFNTCHNMSLSLPSNVTVDWADYSYICHKRGKGTKEVILIGNSIARDLYFGVQHFFNDVFDHLTFFGASGCMTFALKTLRAECGPYVKQLLPIIRGWHRPVDIVIIQQSYLRLWTHNYTHHDALQQDIQQFFTELSKHVKEVIFMNRADLFESHHFQKMQTSILNKEDLSQYQLQYSRGRTFYGDTQKRLDAVKCDKCWKVDYSEAYCDRIKDMCTNIHENKVMQNHDARHSTMYGSLLLAEKLREEYDHWNNSRLEV